MKGMLIKDFNLLKGQKQFFLVAIIFSFIFLFVNDMVTFGLSYLVIMFLMFTLSTMSYDEYDNGYAFLFTLPVSRKAYVKEKYAFCMILTTSACLFNGILIVILTMIKGTGNIPDLLLSLGAALATGIILLSIMLPLQLKFGAEKRQLAFVIGFVGFFILFFLVGTLVSNFGIPEFIKQIAGMSLGVITLATVIIVAIIGGISYHVSVKIIEKKEF